MTRFHAGLPKLQKLIFDNCGTLGIIPLLHLPSVGMTLENAAINDPSYSDPTPSAFNQLHHRAKKWILSSAGFFLFWAELSSGFKLKKNQ